MHTKQLIARRPPERSELAGWYAEVFEAQRMEGLSVSDLADSIGVTAANLYYWRRRLRELGWEDDVVNDPADQEHAPRVVQVSMDPDPLA